MNSYIITVLVIIFAGFLTVLKRFRVDFAFAASTLICLTLVGISVNAIYPLIDYISSLELVGNYGEYFGIVLKSVGISIICTVAAEICKDAGEGALAYGIETFCKCEIIAASLPLIKRILELAEEIMK